MNRRLRSAFIPQRRASSSGPATRLLMTSCVYKEKRWRVPERLGWPEQRSKLTVETDEQQGEVRSWRRLTVMNAAPRQKPITADTPGDYFLNPHSPSSSQPLLSPPLLLPSSSLYTHTLASSHYSSQTSGTSSASNLFRFCFLAKARFTFCGSQDMSGLSSRWLTEI